MSKMKIKRALFFWVDRLQISKKERISITALFGFITILCIGNIFINEKIVPTPENHSKILAEFERRSALIEQNEKESAKKYNPVQLTNEQQDDSANSLEQTQVPISINNGSLEELKSLPGIGDSYAQRIIEYRETNGDFTSVDDLVNVRGIGAKTLDNLKPFIKL